MSSEEVRGRTWFERDYPVLLATARIVGASQYNHAMTHEIAGEMGIDVTEVVKAISNLKQRYVTVNPSSGLGNNDYIITGLTAEGLVAADVWPSTDTVAERLIEALERALDEAPEGSTKQKRIRAALDGVRDLGVGGAGNVLGQAISYALGLVG
jgi:hypothetical protein